MSSKLQRTLILLGSLSLLALPLSAIAAEDTEEDSVPTDDPQLVYSYDSVVHVLIYGFDTPGATEPLTCELPEGTTVEIDPDGVVTVSGGDLPEGCSALNVEGPNGQVNHGSLVSAAVHALKASFDGSMPFGQYVRQFAKSSLDDGDALGDESEADDDDGDASTDSATKSNNGNGRGNSNGNGRGNGNGHGKKNS